MNSKREEEQRRKEWKVVCEYANTCDREGANADEDEESSDNESEQGCGPDDEENVVEVSRVSCEG